MKSCVAILTWNRVGALAECLQGMLQHCGQYDIAIFDDFSLRDDTEGCLTRGRTPIAKNTLTHEIEATRWVGGNERFEVYMGDRNLGVSGNSNRALRWMMSRGYDHICLCNDDLIVTGNFVDFYGVAHQKTQVGLFCFCDFTSETYRWVSVPYRGYKVKLLPRMTGIMMSTVKEVVQAVGYYDMRYGKFGEEHCDYTNRARFTGFLNMDGMGQHCLDLEHDFLKHQEVETSMLGAERQEADRVASETMHHVSSHYNVEGFYRDFSTEYHKTSGGRDGAGIETSQLPGYVQVNGRV